MQPHEYETLRSVEDSHWWYQVLRRLVLQSVAGHLPVQARVLDAGCGTGGMLAMLKKQHPQLQEHGIDMAKAGVLQCRERGLLNVQLGDVAALPYAAETFDAVLCLDVLYHKQVREAEALSELYRVLKPGGLLVINLPAFDCLRGRHDDAVCGARRYTVCHVREMLAAFSMHPMQLHYWNAWSFPLVLAWRQFSRWRQFNHRAGSAVSDLLVPRVWINRLLIQFGLLDARLCRLARIPFGSSVFVIAHKSLRHELSVCHVTRA